MVLYIYELLLHKNNDKITVAACLAAGYRREFAATYTTVVLAVKDGDGVNKRERDSAAAENTAGP